MTAMFVNLPVTDLERAKAYGFMYQRQLTDPDGNILEFGYMDPGQGDE